MTYQSAHNYLAGSGRSSRGWVSRLRGSLGGLGGFLDTSDSGRLGSSTAVGATTSALTAAADKVVKRLVQVRSHDEMGVLRGWQSWRFHKSRDTNASISNQPIEIGDVQEGRMREKINRCSKMV